MTSLFGLSMAFAALTLAVVAGLVVLLLLPRRGADGRRAVPDRASEELATSSTSRKES